MHAQRSYKKKYSKYPRRRPNRGRRLGASHAHGTSVPWADVEPRGGRSDSRTKSWYSRRDTNYATNYTAYNPSTPKQKIEQALNDLNSAIDSYRGCGSYSDESMLNYMRNAVIRTSIRTKHPMGMCQLEGDNHEICQMYVNFCHLVDFNSIWVYKVCFGPCTLKDLDSEDYYIKEQISKMDHEDKKGLTRYKSYGKGNKMPRKWTKRSHVPPRKKEVKKKKIIDVSESMEDDDSDELVPPTPATLMEDEDDIYDAIVEEDNAEPSVSADLQDEDDI